MSRATGSSQGSMSSLGSSAQQPGNPSKKGPAHADSFTRESSGNGPVNDPQRQQYPNIERTGSDENDDGSFLLSPLAWVQKSRERRRREYLQHQAEEQLRKIAEAEGFTRNGEDGNNHVSLPSSGSGGSSYRYGNSNNYGHHDSNDATGNENADDAVKIGTQHLSKSGEGMTAELDWDLDENEDDLLIPKVRIHPEPQLINNTSEGDTVSPNKADFKAPAYILTPEQMHQIAIHVLPKTIAYCQWRRVYSLNRDGDSFEGCLRNVSHVARSLMVVRTTRGAVFGGYADSPWRPTGMGSARFYGSALACLFSVKDPEKFVEGIKSPKNLLNVYRWSGKNRYIQLCDSSSKMLAFGGGGSDGAFGLCVQEDFQSGSTGACDTFDNAPLCDQETFEIVDVEFWEFLTGVF
jgi:hypothetical protein